MGRNEIKLRRQTMSPGQIARHRNYGKLMARHERYLKLKNSIIILIYTLILTLLLIMFFITKRTPEKPPTKTEQHVN